MFFPHRSFEFDSLAGRYVISGAGPAGGIDRDRAAQIIRDRARRDRGFRSALARWAIYEPVVRRLGDELRIVDDIVRAVRLDVLRVHEQPISKPVYTHTFPDSDRRPEPAPATDSDEPKYRFLRRLQLGYLTFRPNRVALLPGLSLSNSPWAGLVAAAKHMESEPGDTPLMCVHQTHNEPPKLSEVRMRALHAFIRDERELWVDLQAEYGSIEDTQVFLSYLSEVKCWPLTIRVTRQADTQTKAAVLAFQRFYNPAYDAAIYEDGIVGRQTLAAIFTVAKDDLSQWFQVNEADYAQLYHLPPESYLACAARYSGIPKFSIGAYGGEARAVDILFIPSGQDFSPAASPPGAGVYVDDATFESIPVHGIRAPQSHLLIIRLIDQSGRPISNADYELIVGDDHRVGTTDAKGEIVEANLPDDLPLVRLVDGRLIVFHDRYRASLEREPAPKVAPSYIRTDDTLSTTPPLYEDAEDVLLDGDEDGDFDEDDEDDEDDELEDAG